jgi:hypothetical protein
MSSTDLIPRTRRIWPPSGLGIAARDALLNCGRNRVSTLAFVNSGCPPSRRAVSSLTKSFGMLQSPIPPRSSFSGCPRIIGPAFTDFAPCPILTRFAIPNFRGRVSGCNSGWKVVDVAPSLDHMFFCMYSSSELLQTFSICDDQLLAIAEFGATYQATGPVQTGSISP